MRPIFFIACLLMLSSCASAPPVCQDDDSWGCDCSDQDDIDLAKYVNRKGCVWIIDQRGSITQICPAIVIPIHGGGL